MNKSKVKKVFQVGFNKCGTTSLADYLKRSGYHHFDHHSEREGNGALIIDQNRILKTPLFQGLEHYDSFTDLEYVSAKSIVEAYKYIKQIYTEYPDAKYILNIRNKDAWIKSRLNHGKGSYLEAYMNYFSMNREEVIAKWETDWDEHIDNVMSTIPESKLLIINIENIDYDALSTFTGSSKTLRMRDVNKSNHGIMSKFLAKNLGNSIKSLVPLSIKNFLKNF